MKKILVSVKPKWVEKILNKEKTIEIRRSIPKCELPCEVYICCTKNNRCKSCLWQGGKYNRYFCDDFSGCDVCPEWINGQVVAKFILNDNFIFPYDDGYWFAKYFNERFIPKYPNLMLDVLKNACLTLDEFYEYGNKKTLYGWIIDNLEIFNEPKKLKEFGLTKAPKNWCYIKECIK